MAARAETLGDPAFREIFGVNLSYMCGSMYRGISSPRFVAELARNRILASLGTGGLDIDEVAAGIQEISAATAPGTTFGANLLSDPTSAEKEMALIGVYLRHGVSVVEASAFIRMSAALVRYRLAGLHLDSSGKLLEATRIIGKVSRPEVAAAFLASPPAAIVADLLANGQINASQAELGMKLPLATAICVEADSGGHTDMGNLMVLYPAIRVLADQMARERGDRRRPLVGASGGLGTPQSLAAAFAMGASFVSTGSINQAMVEAGINDRVKDILQTISVNDTAYAPAGDMFELGAKVQVVSKGLLFPGRARKLREVYLTYDSIDQIPAVLRDQIERKIMHATLENVWDEVQAYYCNRREDILAEARERPKKKMALVFKWYFALSTRVAFEGTNERSADYQIHCGPALGAFNAWVEGTPFQSWRNRKVVAVSKLLMEEAAAQINALNASPGFWSTDVAPLLDRVA